MNNAIFLIPLAAVFVIWAVIVYRKVYKKHDRVRTRIPLSFRFTPEEVSITNNGVVENFKRNCCTDFDHVDNYLTSQYELWLNDYQGYSERKSFTIMNQNWSANLILCDNYVLCITVEFIVDSNPK